MKKNLPLAILSGLLLWLAWPPMRYTTFFLFIGFVPMLVGVENIIRNESAKKGRQIFNLTFIGFFIWNSFSVYWVYNSIKSIGPIIAIPITLIPYSLGPLLMASAFWLYFRLRVITRRPIALTGLVCFWIGYEYLHQNWDLNFPWMTLGNGFATAHQWVQWYEYTGVYGGTIWVWTVNIVIFLIYAGYHESHTKRLRLQLAIAGTLLIIVPLFISYNRYANYYELKNPANIVLAQPNIDPFAKEIEMPAIKQIEVLTHLSDSLGQHNTEFFIWPETAIADYVNEDRVRTSPYYLQVQRFLNKYKNGNVLTGIESFSLYDTRKTLTADPVLNSNQFADNYDAAINIENSAEVQFYHKSKFVPGVEELPFGNALSFMKPAFEHFGGATGSYAGQPESGVFYSQAGIGVDPVICYESIWGGYVASSVLKGAQFIAIVTNDGWFGNSSGKDQHLDYAKLRAIETRRWVCQSANTGISAFINQRGDIVQQTKWWTRTAIKQDINLSTDLTFYVRYGDYLPKAGSILALVGIIWIVAKVRLKRKPVSAPVGLI